MVEVSGGRVVVAHAAGLLVFGGRGAPKTLEDGSDPAWIARVAGGDPVVVHGPPDKPAVYRLDGRDFELLRRQRSLAAYKILRMIIETLGDRRQTVDQRIDDIFARPADHIEQFERYCRELADKASRA